MPQGLEDVSTYPALTAELLRRGYSDADIRKINGLNVLRVMREVERVAKKLQAERGRLVDAVHEMIEWRDGSAALLIAPAGTGFPGRRADPHRGDG